MNKLTIPGQTPSKKNSRNLFVRNGRPINIPSKIHQDWFKNAVKELKGTELPICKDKVTIDYMFYLKDLRDRDVDNMIASINDLLVHLNVISKDSWKTLCIGMGDGILDRENPRCEITIKPYESRVE